MRRARAHACAGTALCATSMANPAATASWRNILTVSSENSREVLADQRQLGEHVRCRGDDVAADLVGLHDIQQLARAGPDQLGARQRPQEPNDRLAMIGTGSRPVSAIRPANTDTRLAVCGREAFDDCSTWSSVRMRRHIHLDPGRRETAMSGPANSPRVFVTGILTKTFGPHEAIAIRLQLHLPEVV